MPTPHPLSAVLITLNAGPVLKACLDSLSWVDDIVVVDGGSSDDTVALARAAGARLFERPWAGFGPQKQFAVDQARHDWVLCIDADERLSPELAETIRAELANPRATAFALARANFFLGRYLAHGEGFPDWSLRLFDRRHARWSDDMVHERVIANGRIQRFPRSARLLHHSAETLAGYLDKQNRYTTLQAEELYRAGRAAATTRLIVAPGVRFLKFYLFKGGFLDGIPGLVHIAIGCFNSFAKYAKLRALYLERS